MSKVEPDKILDTILDKKIAEQLSRRVSYEDDAEMASFPAQASVGDFVASISGPKNEVSPGDGPGQANKSPAKGKDKSKAKGKQQQW